MVPSSRSSRPPTALPGPPVRAGLSSLGFRVLGLLVTGCWFKVLGFRFRVSGF